MGVQVGGAGRETGRTKGPTIKFACFSFVVLYIFLLLFLGLPQPACVCVLSMCVCCLRALPVACHPSCLPPLAAVLATDSHKELLKLINDHRMAVHEAAERGEREGKAGECLGQGEVLASRAAGQWQGEGVCYCYNLLFDSLSRACLFVFL